MADNDFKCPICGEPTYKIYGNYRKDGLCGKHGKMANNGEIVQCADCGKWHTADKPCDCKKIVYTELPIEGFYKRVSCGAETNGYAFCRKCFNKYSTEELLNMLNNSNTNNIEDNSKSNNNDDVIIGEKYSQSLSKNDTISNDTCECQHIIEPQQTNDITCIVCGENSNGKHFCHKCWQKYKNKILYLRIKNCDEYEKLDDEYESDCVCKDGHMVKSLAERDIDDWLFEENIIHAYEKKLKTLDGETVTPDFYIPEYNGTKEIYVEYWGYKDGDNKKYQERKEYKTKIYPELCKQKNIAMVYLKPEDVRSNNFQDKISKAKQGEIT